MQKLSIFHIVLVFLSSYFIIDRLIRFFRKEKTQSFFKLATTLLIWCGILVVVLFPQFATFVFKGLGMGENFNSLIFTAFVIVFTVIFKLLSIIEKLERNITEIVRKEALKEILSGKIADK